MMTEHGTQFSAGEIDDIKKLLDDPLAVFFSVTTLHDEQAHTYHFVRAAFIENFPALAGEVLEKTLDGLVAFINDTGFVQINVMTLDKGGGPSNGSKKQSTDPEFGTEH